MEHFEIGIFPTLKFATQQIYRTLLYKHLLPRFGDEKLADIRKQDVQRFVLDKLGQGLSWKTVNHLRHLLSKAIGTAVEWGYLSENSVRGVKMPERTLKRPRKFLTADKGASPAPHGPWRTGPYNCCFDGRTRTSDR